MVREGEEDRLDKGESAMSGSAFPLEAVTKL
jgi:hypothetical protein